MEKALVKTYANWQILLQEELRNTIGIVNQSSHPHVSSTDGAYNLGQLIGATGPCYTIVHYPNEAGVFVSHSLTGSWVTCFRFQVHLVKMDVWCVAYLVAGRVSPVTCTAFPLRNIITFSLNNLCLSEWAKWSPMCSGVNLWSVPCSGVTSR